MARKKGLEGQYEQVDGSPRPKIKDNVVEPVRFLSCAAVFP